MKKTDTTDKATETKENKNVPAETKGTKTAKAKKERKPGKPGKVPKVLTKKYTEKKLEKKFYKKIFIADDKKFLQSFMVQLPEKNKKGEALYSIPKETKIPKKDCKRLALICKEIKKQKGRIKLAPIVAILVFVAALCIGVTLTKNIILRKVITSTCESVFEAKTDIKSVNLRFRDSSFKLKGLQIANKDQPMKNLIEVDSIVLDFQFSQLLRARVIADELSVNGVATDTDRTTSGDLSARKLAKIEKKKAKEAAKAAKKTEDSAFMKNLNSKSDAALSALKDSVQGLFDQYNPKTIIENCYAQLQTPETSKKVEEQVKSLTAKYQNKPEEIEAEIAKVKASVEAAANLDIEAIKSDPAKVKEAVTTINDAITSVQALKKTTDGAVNDMKADVNTVTGLSKELKSSITHDQNLVTSELNSLTSLSLSDAKNFITDTFNNVGYAVLGKYYPYAKTAVTYLINLKNNNKSKDKKVKTEKTKSTVTNRSKGRTVYFATETAPKLWIKKAAGSGTNFSLTAADITTDMDKTGKPATANIKLSLNNIDHGAVLSVDTRSTSTAPLVTADYNCSKIPVSFPASNFGNVPGVPGLDSANTKLALNMKVYEDEGFAIKGTGNFTNMTLSAAPFEPEFASNIFMNTLSKVTSMDLNINAGYTETDGVIMKLTSDADKKFLSALQSALTAQMSEVTAQAKEEISAKITEITGGAAGDLSSFNSITDKINGYKDYVDSLNAQLEAKKKEAANAATSAVKSAAKSKVDEAASSAKSSAASTLKGLLKK